jgi:ankyrin repeat protein
MRTYGASEFATAFLRDIFSCTTIVTGQGELERYFQPKLSLLAFQTLLPGELSFKRYEHNLTLTATNAMLETNFTQLLVFSITNGFAGLGFMPIAGIFKFLARYGNVGTMFGQILKASSRHVAKSLAENLFKVAIEAHESDVLMQLLRTGLVHSNEIVCRDKRGFKLTAAERAAQLGDLQTLRVLIAENVDMNKTFASTTNEGGVLRHLVSQINPGSTVPDVLLIVPIILAAGAIVKLDLLAQVVTLLHHSDLTLCLLPSLLLVDHTAIFRYDILSHITRTLEQEQARKATMQILQTCEFHHTGQCIRESEDEVEWALVESAKRGHLHVVKLLLPHVRRLDRALTASFSGGAMEVVDLIIARKPAFDFPAHSIKKYSLVRYEHETTPLAEALLTENDDLIDICERSGAMKNLHLDGHLQAALTAAAGTGNSSYFRRLIQHRPLPIEMSEALHYAIKNAHIDIALELVHKGCDLSAASDNILCGAVKARNSTLVRAILDSAEAKISMLDEVLEEAIRWGDRPILSDLHYAFPHKRIWDPACVREIMEQDQDLFSFLLDLDLVDDSALIKCLEVSIKLDDIGMICRLLELGADPSHSGNLSLAASLAASYQPTILKMLLENIPRSKKPRDGLGTGAVMTAIDCGLAGLETLELLLLSGVVDFRSFLNIKSGTDGEWFGSRCPFGAAIKNAVQYKGNFPVVQCLLEAGCDANSVVYASRSPNISNMTALLAAIDTKHIDLVEFILASGAEVNTEAKRGLVKTPLQLAASRGYLEIVQLLIKKGAHVNAAPAQRAGGTALQLAAISGNCNIAAELLSHGADTEAPPSPVRGRWPIEGAAEHGRLDMTEYLLKVTMFNAERCKRAMKLAHENGHMGCYDLISEHVQKQEMEGEVVTMGIGGFS